jgi:hypothetical protein
MDSNTGRIGNIWARDETLQVEITSVLGDQTLTELSLCMMTCSRIVRRYHWLRLFCSAIRNNRIESGSTNYAHEAEMCRQCQSKCREPGLDPILTLTCMVCAVHR